MLLECAFDKLVDVRVVHGGCRWPKWESSACWYNWVLRCWIRLLSCLSRRRVFYICLSLSSCLSFSRCLSRRSTLCICLSLSSCLPFSRYFSFLSSFCGSLTFWCIGIWLGSSLSFWLRRIRLRCCLSLWSCFCLSFGSILYVCLFRRGFIFSLSWSHNWVRLDVSRVWILVEVTEQVAMELNFVIKTLSLNVLAEQGREVGTVAAIVAVHTVVA